MTTEIEDILVGGKTIIVKLSENKSYEFECIDDKTLKGDKAYLPQPVQEELSRRGYTFQLPETITYYINSEATYEDKSLVSTKLGIPENHPAIEQIAGIGYEIEFTISVVDANTYKITHIFGHELCTPKEINVSSNLYNSVEYSF